MTKEEFLNSVPEEFANDDFYELCKLLTDLSLDSEKIRFEDGKIGARFSQDGMVEASKNVRAYLDSHNTNENVLIKAIRVNAHKVVDDTDPRQKVYFDQSQKDLHVAGILYTFTDLPEGVLRKIVQDAKNL